ncbi:MFS transporter [Streptomyces sp. NPDC088748]|uniref:MFS transporter n=1 Tax=Streptomyces sp. NPDC088748 TaxID=3365887 RepID=UPI003830009A
MKFPVIPALPGVAWGVLAVVTISSVGTGLTLPFELFYLHQVRGLSLSQAGLVMAVSTLIAFGGNSLGGVLCDRFGFRRTLTLGLVVEGFGVLALANATEFWQAIAAVVVTGAGGGIAWPAQDALIATTVSEEMRSTAFAMRHAALNVGLGVGGLLAVMVTKSEDPGSFVALFLLDTLTFFLAAGALWLIRLVAPATTPTSEAPGAGTGGGYRAVLRDRTFLRLWLIIFLLVTAGYAQLNSAVPAYLTGQGFQPGLLGVFAAVNAVTVVVAQVVVLRYIGGRRRTSLIAVLCVLWSAAWAALILITEVGGAWALVLVVVAASVFAVGETLLAPTAPVLVNAIAPDDMRGRYNGLTASAFTLGAFVGTLTAGIVLDGGYGRMHFMACIAVLALIALLALRLSAHLPRAANLGDPEDTAPGDLGSAKEHARLGSNDV